MKKSIIIISLFSAFYVHKVAAQKFTKNEYAVLKACEGIIQLFKQAPEEVWPGYNLARQPFFIYISFKWALLFNYSRLVDGFSAYPKDWPDLGCPVYYHQGQYKDWVGQLVFDFPIDTIKAVAISFPEENLDSLSHPEAFLFGGYIHEAFHQYQSDFFGEIPWEREERYPILDRGNTALAYIEMRLLINAMEMMKSNNWLKCRSFVKEFVAVRNYRWAHSDPFVARYEQGQEIREGTARYVEMKSFDILKSLKYRSTISGVSTTLKQDFESISFPDILIKDMQDRMTENSIQPENILRNRIYPVGSSIGFLLDYFHINWKNKAQRAGDEFTFEQLFTDGLKLKKDEFSEIVAKAKKTYHYEKVLISTDKIIGQYMEGFNKELNSFEAQSGYRIQIDFTSRSLSRSKTSAAKKWLVDKGTRSLCSKYQVYTAKNDKMNLQLENSGVLELTDWDAKKYSIVFFVQEIPDFLLDEKPMMLGENSPQSFQKIKLSGSNCEFSYSGAGIINRKEKQVNINCNQ